MMGFVEYELGPPALEFVRRKHLAYGRTLSSFLLEYLDLDCGRITTVLPSGLTTQQLYDFQAGGVMPFPPESEWLYTRDRKGGKTLLTPIPRDDSALIELIRLFLESEGNRLCVFEEQLAQPGEGALSRRTQPFVTFKNEAYHVIAGNSVRDSDIEQTIRYVHTTYLLVGVLSSLPTGYSALLESREITTEQLRVLAERTEKLVVGAYDGEGYLIWNRG